MSFGSTESIKKILDNPCLPGLLKTVEGDATDPQFIKSNEIAIIPHCCNNKGQWGKGFVLALSKKWKRPESIYRNFCKIHQEENILGRNCSAKIDDHLAIVNMIAQDGTVSEDNPKPIRYKALVQCMTRVVDYIEFIKSQTTNPIAIHCPKFGSELAGGTWSFILELIHEIWIDAGIDVVIYEYKG